MKAVTLMLRYKDAQGVWRRAPAAHGQNGRVKPGHIIVEGKAQAVVGGVYSVRHTVDRKTLYTPVGRRADIAAAKCAQLERTKALVAVAAENPDVVITERPGRESLRSSANAYIKNAKDRGAMEAAEQARLVIGEFGATCKRTYIDEVTQDDFFSYHKALRKKGLSDRTVANKHRRLASWMRFAGIDTKRVPPVPKYEDKLPDVYSSRVTSALLAEAGPSMRMMILLALKCGLRDREIQHAEFRDIDYEQKTLRVRAKPQWGFTVKTQEQRAIPLTNEVLSALEEWQSTVEGPGLILPTSGGKPNTKLLLALKVVARRAGLNCGSCASCIERKECQEFTLHRFRRTYITTLLRNQIDLRTVQAYAGHRDLASTLRYLTPETGHAAQAKLNAVRW